MVFAYQNKLAVFILPSEVPASHSPVIRTSCLLLKTPHCLVIPALIPQVPSQAEMKGRVLAEAGRIKLGTVSPLGEEARQHGIQE